jgi:O-antigen ligase
MVNLSGGACLGLLAGFLALAAWRSRTALLVFCGIALGVACLLPNLPRRNDAVLGNSVAMFNEEGTAARRYVEWQAAWTLWNEHPWRGVGAGNYQENIGTCYGDLVVPAHVAEPDSQNLYLVTLASLGVPGFLFLAAMLAGAIGAGFRGCGGAGRERRDLMMAGAGAGVLAFSVAGLWSPLLVRGLGVPLVFLLAWCCSGDARTRL